MSEYQYYEFLAIDRPLSEADRAALRSLSTRARITTTSFTNSYEWGDFKGDPAKLMESWFDLHLYIANWGSRRLMMRLPARLVDRQTFDAFLAEVDAVTVTLAGDNLILDIMFEEVAFEDWDDGEGRLSGLAPLRADVLGGDLRLFYLLWLTAVEADVFEPDEPEPMPGIGPMTGTLEAFADFFGIDPDLVAAAAKRSADPLAGQPASSEAVRPIIAGMSDEEKTALLTRLFDGDTHVAGELRTFVRHRLASSASAPTLAARSVGELLAAAAAMRQARGQVEADKATAERRWREAEAEKARRERLDTLVRRGEGVWREIDIEIERTNVGSYDRAAALLTDLHVIAEEKGAREEFLRRLRAIRERHARKQRFIERLTKLV